MRARGLLFSAVVTNFCRPAPDLRDQSFLPVPKAREAEETGREFLLMDYLCQDGLEAARFSLVL